MTSRVSRYTPWLTSRDDLESIFVARGPLLDDLVDRVGHATESVSRQHTLVVGPRGSGKTHLLALAYYRICDLAKQARVQVARLPEDPWTIDSYVRLLAAILKALGQPDLQETATELEHRLEQCYAANGVVVVIIENLDEVFSQIGVNGQRMLRHFLQSCPALLLLASTPALDRSLTDQTSPFYNYFSIMHLKPLSVDQALELVSHLAAARQDDALTKALEEPAARHRLEVIEHLAGGQPRLWVIFGQILTPVGIRRLADTLMDCFDNLTPYYQDRLRSLSAQQRLVVAELASLDRPLHVQELARRTTKSAQSTARTVLELRDLGWITKVETPWDDLLDRRRSYYELAEPLARLAFQVKESLGEPIRLIVEFLSYWFDPDDTANWRGDRDPYMLELVSVFDSKTEVRVVRRLSRLAESKVPDVELLGQIDDALAAVIASDAEPVLALPTTVRSALEHRCQPNLEESDQPSTLIDLRCEIHKAAMDQMGLVPHQPQSSDWITRAENLASTADSSSATLTVWSNWLALGWQFEQAQAIGALIPVEYLPNEDWRELLGGVYRETGRYEEALIIDQEVLDDRTHILGPDHLLTLLTGGNLAYDFKLLGRYEEALALEQAVIDDLIRILGPYHPHTLRLRNNHALTYKYLGRYEKALALDQAILDDCMRVLGPDHPGTLASRANLAGDFLVLGRYKKALPLHKAVLNDLIRVLGPDHPDTLTSHDNLANNYACLGRFKKALALHQVVLEDRTRVLGPDHPDTLASRNNLAADYEFLGRHEEARTLDGD